MASENYISISEDFTENVFDTIREPLIILNQDLVVMKSNRSFIDFFKVKTEDAVGQLVYDLGNKQWDIPRLRELLENILPQKNSFNDFEVEHDFPAIGRRIMLLNARQIEQEGLQRTILLAIEDVTDKRLIQRELEDSEERFRRLFETSIDGLLLLEKKSGHINAVNPAITQMLGYPEKELKGKTLMDIGIDTDGMNFQEIQSELEHLGFISYQDVPIETREGNRLDTEVYLVDRSSVIQCNVRDVSKRKLLEAFLKNILEGITEGFIVIDRDYKIILANEAFYHQAKRTHEDVIGKHCYEVSHGIDIPCYEAGEECSVRHTFETGESHKCIHTHYDKEGKPSYIETKSFPMEDSNGNVETVIEILHDITEQKQLEENLYQAQKREALGTLAGGIAHDFNNILTVILGYGELALAKTPQESELTDDLHQIRSAGLRAKDLVAQILAFCRHAKFELQPLKLHILLKESLKLLRSTIPTIIEIRQDIASDCGTVLADPTQLHQIIMNLCTNAYHSMRQTGGILAVSLHSGEIEEDDIKAQGSNLSPGTYVVMEISDTGHGMSKEISNKIFDPYFTTKKKGEGTGLGLAVVQGIVKSFGGHITVYSEVNKGTSFRVYLPKVFSVPVLENDQTNKPLPTGSEKILLVDDDEAIAQMESVMLTSLGYQVTSFSDSKLACETYKDDPEYFDVVVTDMTMPHMTGVELVKEIHKICPQMPVILCTGYSELIDNARATALGIKKYLTKPVSKSDLAKAVREALDL